MKTKIILSALLAVSLAASLAWAQGQTNPSEIAAKLEQRLETCDWKVRTLSGGPKGLMLLHQAKMRRILAELKAGQSVDAKDLEAAFREHSS